jgi:hypothetical protein
MIEFILSLSTWAGFLIAIVFSTVCGLVVYLLSYKMISRYKSDELQEPANNVFRVVGVLVSLMLSLAFAEVVVDLRSVENAIEREAVAISDIFRDLEQFDIEGTREIRSILIDYTQAIIDDDWPSLADDRLGQRAGPLYMQLEARLMELEPVTQPQKYLLSRLLADVDDVYDYRLIRLDKALSKPPLYIYAVFFGFLLTMACLGAYRPQIPVLTLNSLYTVFIGMVLYLILALSDPFKGGLAVDPTTHENLVEYFLVKQG